MARHLHHRLPRPRRGVRCSLLRADEIGRTMIACGKL
jgi:hypothetical protein